MASASLVVSPAMSSATAQCEALNRNPTMHVLWRFLHKRKTTKFGCSTNRVDGHFPLPNFSMLPQFSYAIKRFYLASKCLFLVLHPYNPRSCSIPVHLPILLISRSFKHIISPSFAQHNPYPLKLLTYEFSLRGWLPNHYPVANSTRTPLQGINVLPHCNPSTFDWFRAILVQNTQSYGGLGQPLHPTCVGVAFSLVAHSFDFNSVSHTVDSIVPDSWLVA